MLPEVWIADAVRTPIGKFGGGLASVRPDDLAAGALKSLLGRSSALDPACVDDVMMGNANGAGEDNRNVARMAVLLAGLPVTVPGSTVNRLCGSGMDAVIAASRAIACGDEQTVVAGGVESMTRAPWVMQKPETAWPREHMTAWSSTLGWRMCNPQMPESWTVALGEGAELLSDRYQISREEQDSFALRSHRNATAAWSDGVFAHEIIKVPGTELDRDECVRRNCSPSALARLKPIFRTEGSVTAGNSSPMNDGAAALLLSSDKDVAQRPLARIAARAVSALEPQYYGIGPVEASTRALKRAGIRWNDLDSVELNEAFAAQGLACLREMPELNPDLVNPCGGAIALGHPLGASGARILATLAWRLHLSGQRWGLATMCVGVGQGVAVVLEGVPV